MSVLSNRFTLIVIDYMRLLQYSCWKSMLVELDFIVKSGRPVF